MSRKNGRKTSSCEPGTRVPKQNDQNKVGEEDIYEYKAFLPKGKVPRMHWEARKYSYEEIRYVCTCISGRPCGGTLGAKTVGSGPWPRLPNPTFIAKVYGVAFVLVDGWIVQVGEVMCGATAI